MSTFWGSEKVYTTKIVIAGIVRMYTHRRRWLGPMTPQMNPRMKYDTPEYTYVPNRSDGPPTSEKTTLKVTKNIASSETSRQTNVPRARRMVDFFIFPQKFSLRFSTNPLILCGAAIIVEAYHGLFRLRYRLKPDL